MGDRVGLYNPTTATFFLRDELSGGPADTAFRFGPAGNDWTPVAGNWDGADADGIGLYNATTGTFFLKDALSGGPADTGFRFGPAGNDWGVLSGNWNGTGGDGVGLYNAATGTFFLKNALSAGNADITFRFGPAGNDWTAIAGDWNGNGTDGVGLYNAATGTFYLKNALSGGNADIAFRFGPAGNDWTPIVGDWNGDGTDGVGLYNPDNGVFYLKNSLSGGNADATFRFGPTSSSWIPVAGTWEEDEPAPTPGQTFVLTDGIDVFNGTTGNDTFIGDAATAQAADQLDGNGGENTLKLYGNAAKPTISNIQTVYLNGNTAGFDVSAEADVTSLELVDPTTAQIYTIADGQKVSVAQMVDGETIDFAGNTVTELDLTVNKLGTQTAAGVTVDLNSTAQTTLNLTSANNASHVILTNTGAKLTTLTVAGDQKLTVDADTNGVLLTSVDGSEATGDLTLVLADGTAKDINVKGGSGDDIINFGNELTKGDTVNGGDGEDTLAITQASLTVVQGYDATDKAALNANLSNIETLAITDGLTSNIDASRFDDVNQFNLMGGINNGGTSVISKVTSGVFVEYGDAAGTATDILDIQIIDATKAGSNDDTVNLKLNDNAAGVSSDLGVVNLNGVDYLNIESFQKTTGTTTDYVLDIAATSTALDKVTVTGNLALDLSTVGLTNTIQEIDASGMELKTTANGLKVAVAGGGTTGVKITGSDGIDVLTGGDGADLITSGSGNDTITGGKGNDTIDISGGGSNTLVFADSAANNGEDNITGFNGGAVADGGDVFDFGTNFLGTTATTSAKLALTSGSTNQGITNDDVYQITLNIDVADKDYSDADFNELFGAGTGQFSTTITASDKCVILVKGNDTTQIYFVADADTNTTLIAGEVDLVGTADIDGNLVVANFA